MIVLRELNRAVPNQNRCSITNGKCLKHLNIIDTTGAFSRYRYN